MSDTLFIILLNLAEIGIACLFVFIVAMIAPGPPEDASDRHPYGDWPNISSFQHSEGDSR
jgi:hypothetical protein